MSSLISTHHIVYDVLVPNFLMKRVLRRRYFGGVFEGWVVEKDKMDRVKTQLTT